ncbi:hypothetical protein AB0F17_10865 [Nonomuraea sp. NPDC026600]|uniref:hypothetical protein n=1 Tax=Nonomuraea sp. NPDC026600 TaxID=3155363 RepID=UPI0033EA53DB
MLSDPDPINAFYDHLKRLIDSKGKGTLPKLQTYSERNSPELRLKASTLRGWLKDRKTVPEWDKIALILDYFKIANRQEWYELWTGAHDTHADRLSVGTPESPPPQEAPLPGRSHRGLRTLSSWSMRTKILAAVALLVAIATGAMMWLWPLVGDDAGQIWPVEGQPVYRQCSPRDRSILSQPGQVRGGQLLGHLRVGERFVISKRTTYWRFGQVEGDVKREGWVMASYLCLVG